MAKKKTAKKKKLLTIKKAKPRLSIEKKAANLASKISELMAANNVHGPEAIMAMSLLAYQINRDFVAETDKVVKKRKAGPKSWHTCNPCAKRFGGVIPHDQGGITVMGGKCPDCGEDATLIPLTDFHWPKLGVRAVFD